MGLTSTGTWPFLGLFLLPIAQKERSSQYYCAQRIDGEESDDFGEA
jgi:hypothetical protein